MQPSDGVGWKGRSSSGSGQRFAAARWWLLVLVGVGSGLFLSSCLSSSAAENGSDAVVVPDVAGESIPFAREQLKAARLTPQATAGDRGSSRLVVQTAPEAGRRVPASTPVQLRSTRALAPLGNKFAPLAFDRVRSIDDRTLRVRVLAPRCCRPLRSRVQIVGYAVRPHAGVQPLAAGSQGT